MEKTIASGQSSRSSSKASSTTSVPKTKAVKKPTNKKVPAARSNSKGRKKPTSDGEIKVEAVTNGTEELHQQSDEEETVASQKPRNVTLELLIKRYKDLEPDFSSWSHDKQIEALHSLTHVRLDREGLSSMDGLELLSHNVTNIYLQHNRIVQIENLESFNNLLFLTMSNNCLSAVEGLRHLSKLGFLDLSENTIRSLNTSELPVSVFLLNLEGNPCCDDTDYRQRVISRLPRLFTLDSRTVTAAEREEAGHTEPRIPAGEVEDDDEEEEGAEDEDAEDETDILLRELKMFPTDVESLSSVELFGKMLDRYKHVEDVMESFLNEDVALLPSYASILQRSQSRQEADLEQHQLRMAESAQRLAELDVTDVTRSQSQASEESYQPMEDSKEKEEVKRLPSASRIG